MRKRIFILFGAFLFLSSFVMADETLTLTTYYPSPFGAYDRMRLVPRDSLETPCDLGMMYFDKNKKQLLICQEDSSGNTYWGSMGVWVQEGTNIYPADGESPNVGIGTIAPQGKLQVARGDAIFDENIYVGENGYFDKKVSIGDAVLQDKLAPIRREGPEGWETIQPEIPGTTLSVKALDGIAIFAQGEGSYPAVQATGNVGVRGSGVSYGGYFNGSWAVFANGTEYGGYFSTGRSGIAAVYGQNNHGAGVGVYGENLDGAAGSYAGYFDGGLYASGNVLFKDSLIVGELEGTSLTCTDVGHFNGNLHTTSDLAVDRNATVKGNLTVNGTLNAAILTFTDLNVTNRITAKYLDAGTSANIPLIDGPLTINNNLTVNGTINGETIGVSSSREYKKDIMPLASNDALDALKGLNPVTYRFKNEEDQHHVGFIAEEVPDLVATPDRKTISPMDIVAVLTRVVQEQQKEIEQLKAKFNNP